MTRSKHGICQGKHSLWFSFCLVGVAVGASSARAQLPSTDIWLAGLHADGDEIRVGRPENVTRRFGYDNQPCFLPDSRAFLYTRGDSATTEVYRFDRATGRSFQVTETPESEYSPTPFARERDGFCTVRVEGDGAQRLWHFEPDGSNPRLVLAGVDSVGYFAWIDRSTVALFVVGEPHTLRIVDVKTGRETAVARDIGRALHRIPRSGNVSFLIHAGDSDPPLYVFWTWNGSDRRSESLIPAVGAGQDAAWIDDTLIMADGSKLFRARPFEGPAWSEIVDLGAHGIAGITRVAVSPDHRWIALVAAPLQ